MPTLEGTNVDPRGVNSIIDRKAMFKEGSRSEVNALREGIAKWELFEGTRTGQIVLSLAEPMINQIKAQIVMSAPELMKVLGVISKDMVDEYRAECRGALKVWEDILYRSKSLEGRLDEINKFEEDEEKKHDKKVRGIKDVPKAVENYVDT